MLDVSEQNMGELIDEALEERRKITNLSAERKRRYASNRYREDWESECENHDNQPWELIVNRHPALVYSNPQVEFQSQMKASHQMEIEALEFGMNGWITTVQLDHTLNMIALDTFFDYGIGMVDMQNLPGYEDDPSEELPPPLIPRVTRISPRRFFCDPWPDRFEDCRFYGHIWIKDKNDLLKDPRFDEVALRYCAEDVEIEDENDYEGTKGFMRVKRGRIVGYEVYVPEYRKIFTYGFGGSAGSGSARAAIELREPYDYFGHRRGPYVMFGMYWVPDQVYPLPMLAVTEEDEININKHIGQIADDAGSAKQMVFVNGDDKVVSAIETGLNRSVFAHKNFNRDTVIPIQTGGAQQANVDYVMFRREAWDRKSGLSDAKRGKVTGEGTATENQIASSASDARTAYERKEFRRCVSNLLARVAYLMHESPEVSFPVEVTDPYSGQVFSTIFIGGDRSQDLENPTPHIPFELLHIGIEPFSMEWMDEALRQRRVVMAFDAIERVLGLAMQVPALRVENCLDDIMESINIKGGADRYLDMTMFRQMQMMQMMMNAQQAATNSLGLGGAGAGGEAGGGNSRQAGTPVAQRRGELSAAVR